METGDAVQAGSVGKAPTGGFRGRLWEAARFWEPRRLVYNAVLLVFVFLWVVRTWPHFRPAMTLEALGIMSVLALLANVCYSAAYLVDLSVLSLAVSATRRRGRWALWVVGMLLAILFENYWIADEIYPFVR